MSIAEEFEMAIAHIFVICILKVYICTANDFETTTEEVPLRVWNINELSAFDESRILKYTQYSDGVPPLKFSNHKIEETEAGCFEYNQMCLSEKNGTNEGPVCSYHRKYGLVGFPVDCDINLKNCLIKAHEETLGIRKKKDTFYYNDQGKDCNYYTEQSFNIQNAIKLYLLHGSVRRHLKFIQDNL